MAQWEKVESQSKLLPGENIDEKIKKNFFLRAEVTKKDCYVGECIMASFKAYSRLDANSNVVSRPSLTGFSVIEMVDAYNTLPDVELYNGVYYNTHLIRKVQLFALEPGEFDLEPAEVETMIQLHTTSGVIYRQLSLQTPALKVHVKPLPRPPDSFTGAVGKFNIALKLESRPVQFQPVTVKLVVSGTGNLPLITEPAVDWPVPPEIPDPQVAEHLNKYEFPLAGQKIFEYNLPARDTGTFRIPPVQFIYFDPSIQEYTTVTSSELRYTVAPGESERTEIADTPRVGRPFPLHYLYFGIVVATILVVIIVQLRKNSVK